MTPVIPPAAATAGAAPAAPVGHGAVLATVPDAPPAAARLDPGTIITGTVLGRDSQGHVTIRTDKGVLALATPANLPVGSTVSMEVRVAGARLQLVILSVELPTGEKLPMPVGQGAGGPALPAPGALPAAGPTPPTPAAVLAALSGGNLVMATVVQSTRLPGGGGQAAPVSAPATGPVPATGPAPAGASVPLPNPPGSAIPAQGRGPAGPLAPAAPPSAAAPAPMQPAGSPGPAAAGTPPAPAPAPAGSAAQPAAAASAQPSPAVPEPGPQARLAEITRVLAAQPSVATRPEPLPAGAELGLRILGAALPGDPDPTIPARPAGTPPLTAGVVVAETPAGHPVIDTPAGRLVLAAKAALPAGTVLLIELPPSLPAATPAPGGAPDQAMLALSRGWPALAQALAALTGAGEPEAAALAARLPQAGPRLAAGLVTLMNQLAAGDIGEWLGPALREALERVGRRELVDRLRSEFQQLSRLAGEPAGGDWRVMFLPLQHGQDLHQVNLYLRGKRRGSDGRELDSGTRFVVEVDMTRLGPMQLDGLVHGRRFDLMLRTRVPLAASMRRDIEAIFEDARAIGGYSGTIGFQVAGSFPVAPLDQAKRRSAAGGVVV